MEIIQTYRLIFNFITRQNVTVRECVEDSGADTGEDTKLSSNEKRAFIVAEDKECKQGRSAVTKLNYN